MLQLHHHRDAPSPPRPPRSMHYLLLITVLLRVLPFCATATTDPGDLAVLQSFFDTVTSNLPWDKSVSDPCAQDEAWTGVFCSGGRVTQLQLKNLNLKGTLPSTLNRLTELEQLALQGNSLGGDLPSFSGMSKLTSAYLTDQQFSSIPSDFFSGLTSLQILSLENNPVNSSLGGWSLPTDLASATALTSLDLTNCSLTGSLPDFLGSLTSLQSLKLSYNSFTGGLPASLNKLTQLSLLQVNNNSPGKLSGSIDVVASMPSLKTLWLHVNAFNGTIPSSLADIVSLQDLRLNDNNFVGLLPWGFNGSTTLQTLMVQNNDLCGPLPSIGNSTAGNYTFDGPNNKFCQPQIGVPCDVQISALLSFMEYVNFPPSFTSSNSWDGVDPCGFPGVSCDRSGNITSITRKGVGLSGTISPYIANLTYLTELDLANNNLTGTIPEDLTKLNYLVTLDVSNNNIYGPVPDFNTRVTLILTGNPNIGKIMPPVSPASGTPSVDVDTPGSSLGPSSGGSSRKTSFSMVVGISVGVAAVSLSVLLIGFAYCKRKRKFRRVQSPNALQSNSTGSDSEDIMKITVDSVSGNGVVNVTTDGTENVHVLEDGNLVISIQVIREVTNNFSEENVLGKGGFGVVYKGQLDDGTKIAVKRMLASVVSNKGLDEFQAEIAVLTKVRHRHLVSLLGYCIEGNERLLVYEYMPLGTLSQHLFEWQAFQLPPLSWDKRLSIALDVARGLEYLHGLAHKSFIHRDLKPSNILLGDDYRAKVSDFGLVKLAPEGANCSVETRLAGTFGYLAPEYAVTGRVTTKVDVFSFGVVLLELITGRKALDDSQPEESMHLVTWFRRQFGSKGALFGSVDPTLTVDDETSQSIIAVAELAGHCTAREPYNRPDMSHAVNVLSPLVEQWKPMELCEDDEGIDLHLTLPQALKKWQAYEGSNTMSASECLDDEGGTSMASIPPRPSGLAQTFSSADGR